MAHNLRFNTNIKRILVWGAGDQCRVNFQIIQSSGMNIIALVDDTPNLESPFLGVPLIKGHDFDKWVTSQDTTDLGFVIAIGNPYGHVRVSLAEKLKSKGLTPIDLVDETSLIRDSAIIGKGIQVMPHALIHNDAVIGDQCIINTKSLVEHDCVLENGVEIGPGAILCGRVNVGENTWIGAGAVVRPRVKIGKNAIIGAGAVVVKDIPDSVIAVGCPARPVPGKKTISSTVNK